MHGDAGRNGGGCSSVTPHSVHVACKWWSTGEHSGKESRSSRGGSDHAGCGMEVKARLIAQPIHLNKQIALTDSRSHCGKVQVNDPVLIHVDPGGLPVVQYAILA